MKLVKRNKEIDVEEILKDLHNYRLRISQEVKSLDEEFKSK